jgi:hypothetical protein
VYLLKYAQSTISEDELKHLMNYDNKEQSKKENKTIENTYDRENYRLRANRVYLRFKLGAIGAYDRIVRNGSVSKHGQGVAFNGLTSRNEICAFSVRARQKHALCVTSTHISMHKHPLIPAHVDSCVGCRLILSSLRYQQMEN